MAMFNSYVSHYQISHSYPIKPSFSYGFAMVFLWFSYVSHYPSHLFCTKKSPARWSCRRSCPCTSKCHRPHASRSPGPLRRDKIIGRHLAIWDGDIGFRIRYKSHTNIYLDTYIYIYICYILCMYIHNYEYIIMIRLVLARTKIDLKFVLYGQLHSMMLCPWWRIRWISYPRSNQHDFKT